MPKLSYPLFSKDNLIQSFNKNSLKLNTHFLEFQKKSKSFAQQISLLFNICMKEKTKQLKAQISQAIASVENVGKLTEKKSIEKKIKSLAKDLEKLIQKEDKKKQKEEKKALKKAEKEASKKPKTKEEPKTETKAAPAAAKAPAVKKAEPKAEPDADAAKNLKAEVWKASDKK